MCTYHPKRISLTEDATCYKVLIKYDESGALYSPYYDFRWIPGETVTDKRPIYWGKRKYLMSEGVFHAFRELKDAVCLAYNFNANEKDYLRHRVVIGVFRVPKNAEFVFEGCDYDYQRYSGKNGEVRRGILMSNTMEFVGEVDYEKVAEILENEIEKYKDFPFAVVPMDRYLTEVRKKIFSKKQPQQ